MHQKLLRLQAVTLTHNSIAIYILPVITAFAKTSTRCITTTPLGPSIMLSSSASLRAASNTSCRPQSTAGSRAAAARPSLRSLVAPSVPGASSSSSSWVPWRRMASTAAAAAAAGNGSGVLPQQQHAPQHVPLPEVSGPRVAIVTRQTKETRVEVRVNLDGTGRCVTNTPVGFLNHMLDQLASHGLFDVFVEAQGDTWIDDHHTVEDIALALGSAFSQALGDRKGIHRWALDEWGFCWW